MCADIHSTSTLQKIKNKHPPNQNKRFDKVQIWGPQRGISALKPFSDLPGNWKASWFNLYQFWKEGGFHNLHNIMVDKFKTFGPIYREKLGSYESVNIIDPKDAAILFKSEGLYPERFTVPPWIAYRNFRNKPCGVLLKKGDSWRQDRLVLNKEAMSLKVTDNFIPLLNEVGEDFVKRMEMKVGSGPQDKWTTDLTHELFRFALESICNVLYGSRLGLLQDFIDPEAQKFIDAITLMFNSTLPMLYIPPEFLRRINSKYWQDHVNAWDVIFMHADKCIQNIYQDLCLNQKRAKEYRGILCSLLIQNQMPIEDIKASITEMMAGGVDTTSITLQWALYELARAPQLQDQLRSEISAAKASSQGDVAKMMKSTPLLKATIKETLRYKMLKKKYIFPVGQLLIWNVDIVILADAILNLILVQVGLYAMFRDSRFFSKPLQFNPERWIKTEDSKYFRGLSFGFGPRQCLGRRIAELEMQLFLIHMLEKFKIEIKRSVEVGTTFGLILIPDKPIYLTLRLQWGFQCPNVY
uniref:Cholesterol side-chain cleavage enzyme, mitochondrial n=1 Tax=Pseudonaja textilis TaxID=8673 RepID=A0A670YAD8_PSETE